MATTPTAPPPESEPRAARPEEPPAAPSPGRPEAPEADFVPADDAVIGRAFRWSLAVFAVVAVVVGGFLWWRSRPAVAPTGAGITVAGPVEVQRDAAPPDVAFTDVTAAAGIDFVHFTGAKGDKLLPETMGGGGAFFDLDRDGDQDLLLVSGTDWPHEEPTRHSPTLALYRNRGDGTFEDATASAVPALDFYGMGVTTGDYDGDGWTDVYVTAVGENRLLRNVEGRLVDVTRDARVAGGSDTWSTGSAFFDFDGDGDLDLFVGNYVEWSKEIDFELDYRLTGVGRAYGPPLNYEGTHSVLYRNEGDGTFTDVSETAGIPISNPATGVPVGKALAVAPLDVDRDGAVDVFVANDTTRNFLFHNLGDGTFEEVGELYGLAYDSAGAATGAMGVDAGYYRNDAELGFLIGNFANEMTSVFVSQGDPTVFTDEAITEGIGAATRLALSFGVLLLDYDLDGRLDLLQSNGHLEENIAQVDPSQSYRQAAQLFWNAGPEASRTFVLVDPAGTGDLAKPIVGRGSAAADIDGDGDLDLLLLQAGGPPLLLRNEQALGHHWLRLRLRGDDANPDALGAWIEVTAGGSTQRRQVQTSRSYLSASPAAPTFGLGAATSVDSVVVTWPDGTREEIAVPGVDREWVVEQGAGEARAAG